MKSALIRSCLFRLSSCMLVACIYAMPTYAQDTSTPVTEEQAAPSFEDENVRKSIDHMLRRAQLTRTLAAEHITYLKDHRDSADIRLMEDAAQVMAFDLVCDDEKLHPKRLNEIAADISFKIAMLAGNSTISQRLARISAQQSIMDRMELVGDIATTVLMFEIGRRRGLFDALVTDFGTKRFCAGMENDMRTRYNDLISGLGTAE